MSLHRHTCTHTCLETHEGYEFFFFFFFETQYLLWCLYIYFFLGHYVVHLLFFFFFGVRCHTRIFYGTFFENYGLGLGLALFRLGIQMGPEMKKDFNLSRKFFQTFRENLGFETRFKFQFGDNLAWMTIQVSNWVIHRFGSSNPNMLGVIWLGWPSKSQIGYDLAWRVIKVSNWG